MTVPRRALGTLTASPPPRRHHMPTRSAVTCLALAAVLLLPSGAGADETPWQVREQQYVYELNHLRFDPVGGARALGLNGAGLVPSPPLVINDSLAAAAAYRAADLESRGWLSHLSSDGRWPNQVVRDFGFPLPTWWTGSANYVESLYAGPAELPLVLAFGSESHRQHLLGQEWFLDHTEVGVGRSGIYWSVLAAPRNNPRTYVTGVVFDDTDGDGVMDLGEGMAGVTVAVIGLGRTTTGPGGGWAVQVPDGVHRVVAFGGGLPDRSTAVARVAGFNTMVDFVSGQPEGRVFEYRLCRGRRPTILGTPGDDLILGTQGADIIQSLDGDDRIRPGGGNDIVCAGSGNDTVFASVGHDLLIGEAGADVLDGGGGRDRLVSGPGNDIDDGGARDDRINGGPGNDQIHGGAGTADICLNGEIVEGCEL